MILDLAMLHPRREPAEFPVVAVVRHPHLRTDEKDLVVVNNDTTIINNIFVGNWPESSMIRHWIHTTKQP